MTMGAQSALMPPSFFFVVFKALSHLSFVHGAEELVSSGLKKKRRERENPSDFLSLFSKKREERARERE